MRVRRLNLISALSVLIIFTYSKGANYDYKNEIDGYSIQFPDTPKIETKSIVGMPMTVVTYETNELRLTCVSYQMPDILYNNVHMSKDPEYAIKYHTEREINKRSDVKHEVKYFHQNTWPASDLTFYTQDFKSEIRRTVLRKNKLIMCGFIAKNNHKVDENKMKIVVGFLNSFKVDENLPVQIQDTSTIQNEGKVVNKTPFFTNRWFKGGITVFLVLIIGFIWDIFKKKKPDSKGQNN